MDKEFLYKLLFYSKRLLNGILFYVGWFVCVYSAAKDVPDRAVMTTLAILAIHFTLFEHRLKDLVILVVAVTFGFLFDTFYIWIGWLHYHSPSIWLPWAAPLWILSLHAIFATTINHSLSWLKHLPMFSSLLGAAGVAFTYLAGERMGAVDFLAPWYIVCGGIAGIWFFYLPALYRFSTWLDKRMDHGYS